MDRVLNGRAKVREETARRVQEAAQRIGFHAVGLIHQRLASADPDLTIGYVLPKEKQAFFQAFKAVAERPEDGRVRAVLSFSPSQSPADFVHRMEALAPRVDAIAATAVAHMDVADAVQRIQATGRPCFALMNDFAQGIRQSYIGLNNMKAGRIAAHMIATAVHDPGKVAVFVGGFRWHGHELRETGFRSYFREHAPGFNVLETRVNLETRQLTYDATHDLLKQHSDLRGIYCAGGGMEGAIAALREARDPGDVALVVHELTPESRHALDERYLSMAIATPVEQMCRDLASVARRVVEGETTPRPGQHFLRPDLYLPESL